MADNVTLPATGTGTADVDQATDDCAGVHYPVVKLADGTADSTTRILAGNGTAAGALRVTVASDSTGALTVDLGANNDVVATGDVAHGTADAGNPVKLGARATAGMTGRTMESADDRVHLFAGLDGVLLVRPYAPIEDCISERVNDTGGTATLFTNFGATTDIINCITGISIYNTNTTTSGYVDFRDGTTGTILFTAGAPAGGGACISLPTPIKTTAGTGMAYDVSAAISGGVIISVTGFRTKA